MKINRVLGHARSSGNKQTPPSIYKYSYVWQNQGEICGIFSSYIVKIMFARVLVAVACYLLAFLAVPMLHWFTLVANRKEQRVSWREVARGDMLTNIKLQNRRAKRLRYKRQRVEPPIKDNLKKGLINYFSDSFHSNIQKRTTYLQGPYIGGSGWRTIGAMHHLKLFRATIYLSAWYETPIDLGVSWPGEHNSLGLNQLRYHQNEVCWIMLEFANPCWSSNSNHLPQLKEFFPLY